MMRSRNNDRRVGLIYDDRMCNHHAPDAAADHPESPARIRAIWDRLNSSGLAKRCVVLKAKEADDEHLALVHKPKHIDLIKNISSRSSDARKKTSAKFDSIYFSEGSSEAAYLAAGSVVEVADKVAKGELDSAFAIVRPPGHHAERNKPMGFCLHNNVAVATKYLLNERRELGVKKILIVDWDVHHGNGTQKMFYNDPRVLFFSVHRFHSGNFYPSGPEGSYTMTGEGPGSGYNINVPWESDRCGDADYVAVWDQILVHVAKEFNPDLIMISAGFDAAEGDPLGGCCVSPYGFSILLQKLLDFAGGKIVMALEGGYNLDSIANSAHACVEVLLQGTSIAGSLEALPLKSTRRVIQEVRQELSTYWPSLAGKLPHNVTNRASPIKLTSSNIGSDHENLFPSKDAPGNPSDYNLDFEAMLPALVPYLANHLATQSRILQLHTIQRDATQAMYNILTRPSLSSNKGGETDHISASQKTLEIIQKAAAAGARAGVTQVMVDTVLLRKRKLALKRKLQAKLKKQAKEHLSKSKGASAATTEKGNEEEDGTDGKYTSAGRN